MGPIYQKIFVRPISFPRLLRGANSAISDQEVGTASTAIEPGGDWGDAVMTARDLMNKVIGSVDPIPTLIGIGIGVPGPVDQRNGLVGFASNSASWVGVDACQVAELLNAPVLLDNTSHLGSLGEVAWGAALGYDNVVYLKLSTGIGAGFVLNGSIFKGSIGAAGEIGHITVDKQGPGCRCGNRGCLEVYAGTSAIVDLSRPVLGPDATIFTFIQSAKQKDRTCIRILEDIGHIIGTAMAGVCNLLNPQRIVIGGDLVQAGDLLLDPLRFSLTRHALSIVGQSVEVVVRDLGEDAGALGGAALVLRSRKWSAASGVPSQLESNCP